MICPNCGKAIEHMSEFCKYCGKPTNAAARYSYRPPIVPIRSAEFAPEKPAEKPDTSTREALDRLAVYVQKLPTQKQMKTTMFRYAIVLALLTLLCTAICAIGIAKNRSAIAELKEQVNLTSSNAQKTDLLSDTTATEATPATTPAATNATMKIHFELNLPKDADSTKFPQIPADISTALEEEIELPILPDTDTYRFIGWNTRPNGKGEQFSATAKFDVKQSSDITLFAQWELIEKK